MLAKELLVFKRMYPDRAWGIRPGIYLLSERCSVHDVVGEL